MSEENIRTMLDQLAEFESQRDGLAAQKAALLSEVKVPAEIQAIIDDGMRRMNAAPVVDRSFEDALNFELSALVIPDEIRDALAKIDAARAEINNKRQEHQREILAADQVRRANIQVEINAATAKVYADIATRKAEIEAEFGGDLDAVNRNIEDLKARIKAETIQHGKTVKASFWQSVFTPGRTTWKTDFLDGCYFDLNQAVKDIDSFLLSQSGSLLDIRASIQKITDSLAGARKVGEPSTMLRRNQ